MNDMAVCPAEFLLPPREFGLFSLWSWNEKLDVAEIVRQIADYQAAGVYGLVIPLRDNEGIFSKLQKFMQMAIEEASRRDIQVALFIEGLYPSGGPVVAEPDAEGHCVDHGLSLKLRPEETRYFPFSAWSKERHDSLMGYSAESEDINAQYWFEIPGHVTAWRDIKPGAPAALEGAHSTQAKCTSSAMIHQGKQRNGCVCLSGHGRELSNDAMLWLANYCFVRGVNLLAAPALPDSAGSQRSDERLIDVDPNSAWWNNCSEFALYSRRMCWLNTDSRHVCNVAILAQADSVPWRASRICFENQRDFNYLGIQDLVERAELTPKGISLGGMFYEALILDGDYALHAKACAVLEKLKQYGRLVEYGEGQSLIDRLDSIARRDLCFDTPQPHLRYRHVKKAGLDWYLLFNEGPTPVESAFTIAALGPQNWNHPWMAANAPMGDKLILQPRQMRLLVVQGTTSTF